MPPRANPYPGPRSFHQGERLYGRARETASLLDLLIAERIVLLHSPSGAGKTSLLQAGLTPALEAEGFRVLPSMRVNAALLSGVAQAQANRYSLSCILSLEEALTEAQQTPLAELAGLTLGDYLDRYPSSADDGAQWHGDVLIFDQFEEVLTLDPTDRADKLAFFEQVGQALRNRSRWAIFALREEFVASLDPYLKPIPTRFDKGRRFRLELLGRDAALQAVQQPARIAGVEFTDVAAAHLVDDLRATRVQQPDGSTLLTLGDTVEPVQLQVVCSRLWEGLAPDDAAIDLDDVAAVGDVDEALRSYYAEKVAAVAAETGVSQRALRDWVENQLIAGQEMRGQVLQEVDASQGLPNPAIWRLVDAHLLRAEQRRGATWFELAHDRLVGPVRADNASWRDSELQSFQRTALLWERQGKLHETNLLLSRQLLADAQQWVKDNPYELSPVDRDFIAASQAAQRKQQIRQRLTVATILFGILLLVAAGAQIRYLNDARQEDKARLLSSRARLLQVSQPDLNLLLSMEAISLSPRSNNEINAALLAALNDDPQLDQVLRASDHAIKAVAVDPKRRLLAAGDDAGQVFIWDLNQERQAAVSPLMAPGPITDLAFAPGRSLLAAADKSGAVTLWDLSGPLGLRERDDDSAAAELWRQTATPPPAPPPQETALVHAGQVNGLAWRRDGQSLATVGKAEVLLWKVVDLTLADPVTLESGQPTWSVAFSPEGDTLAVGHGDGAITLHGAFPETTQPLLGETGTVRALAFSPDGRMLAAGVNTRGVDHDVGVVQVWDLLGDMASQMVQESPAVLRQTLRNHGDAVESAAFSGDGQILASAGRDSTIYLWNVVDGVPQGEPLRGHLGWINDLAFEPGSSSLFSAGASGEVNHWLLGRRTRLGQPLSGHSDQVWAVAFSPDSARLASGSKDFSVRLWDVASQDVISLEGHDQPVSAVAWSPDGKLLASGSLDSSVILWDANLGAMVERLAGRNWVTALALDPTGKRLATADADNRVLLWDVSTTPAVSTTLTESLFVRVSTLAFNPDSTMLYGGDAQGRVFQWDVARQRLSNAFTLANLLPITSLAIDPTGKLLAAASYDNAVYLWRLPSLRPLGSGVLAGHTRPASGVAFHPNGKLLASSSLDGTIILWDIETQQQIGSPLRGHGAPVNAVAFSPDGRWLASAGDDKAIILWPMTPDDWMNIACRIVGRPLTEEEEQQYLNGESAHACLN